MPRRSSVCDHESGKRPAWRLGARAGAAITTGSCPSIPSGPSPNPSAMNKYARLAMSHWQRTDPDRYTEIPEPKEMFFQQLGEQAEREIQQLEDAIAGSDPPNEDYLTKVGRLNAARQAAQGAGARRVDPHSSPDSTQQPDPDRPAKTILQDVLEAIEQADQERDEQQ